MSAQATITALRKRIEVLEADNADLKKQLAGRSVGGGRIVGPPAGPGEVCIHGSRNCGAIYCKSERVKRATRAGGPPSDAPGEG